MRGEVALMTQPMSSAPMGVLPNQAIWCRAMTRPCMAGSVACWSTTVSSDWKQADAKPSGTLRTRNAP